MKITFDWSIYLALNTNSNGELSDPLSDSVNRGLTLVRLKASYCLKKLENEVSFST